MRQISLMLLSATLTSGADGEAFCFLGGVACTAGFEGGVLDAALIFLCFPATSESLSLASDSSKSSSPSDSLNTT